MKKLSITKLIIKNLVFYRKLNLTLLLCTLITAMVLTGALVTGDSVKFTLNSLLYERIGKIKWSIQTYERYFSASLGRKMAKDLKADISSILSLKSTVSILGGEKRAAYVETIGYDDNFFKLSLKNPNLKVNNDSLLVNFTLAEQLNLKINDEVIVRIKKPSAVHQDSPFSTDKERGSIAMKLKVQFILTEEGFGRFSLKNNHVTKPAVFIPLKVLNEKLGDTNKANVLLVPEGESLKYDIFKLNETLKSNFSYSDIGLKIKDYVNSDFFDVTSENIFISNNISQILTKEIAGGENIFTYFVNQIRKNNMATPYSFISSLSGNKIKKLEDDEIIITSWLKDDLNANKGDVLDLEYYIINQNRKLEIKKSQFKVNSIIDLHKIKDGKTLMPDFPGLTEAGNCTDWDLNMPLNFNLVREKDEQYWELYKGTPKAIISLNTAKKIWGNQFGSLTAIRFNIRDKKNILKRLNEVINPEKFGFNFENIRDAGIKSGNESQDFSGLFIGLSFFIIVSSLILSALFFVFSVENRIGEIGTFTALGFNKKTVLKIFLIEGMFTAFIGSFIGSFSGIFYNKLILSLLSSIWIGAVQTSALKICIKPLTLVGGFGVSVILIVSVLYFSLKKLLNSEVVSLQSKFVTFTGFNKKPSNKLFISTLLIPVIILLFLTLGFGNKNYETPVFFVAGAMLLLEGFLVSLYIFKKIQSKTFFSNSRKLSSLGIRNVIRNPWKSLTAVMLLSIGVFLVVSVSSNRKNFLKDSKLRTSGTGGFDLWMETSMPIYSDLRYDMDKRKYLSNFEECKNLQFVGMRLLEGDEASCLNLNRSVSPNLLGINTDEFKKRNAFSISKILKPHNMNDKKNFWCLLDKELKGGYIPAVADATIIKWGLGKSIGDTITYINEKGEEMKIKFVAGLTGSVFQGYIVISEKNLLKHFPSQNGYNIFLIENIEKDNDKKIISILSKSFLNFGVSISKTVDRLNKFYSVENTYLTIFLILGGFGLILGSFGFGALMVRNIIERKGEISILKALGFNKKNILKMLIYEYLLLLFLSIITGVSSGILAVFPVLTKPGTVVPVKTILIFVVFIALCGFLSVYAAGALSLKGNLLSGLRDE